VRFGVSRSKANEAASDGSLGLPLLEQNRSEPAPDVGVGVSYHPLAKNMPGTSREVAPSEGDDEAIAVVELGAVALRAQRQRGNVAVSRIMAERP